MQRQKQLDPTFDQSREGRSRIAPRSYLILLLLVILAGFATGAFLLVRQAGPGQVGDQPILAPPPPAVDPQAIKALLPRGSIQAIDNPQFETVSEAAGAIDADERVIGVVINGDARAYPINILSAHEIVNDVVGGEPIAVTWCPLCYSALVFSRRVDEFAEPLIFGVSGSLLYETLVMYDQQTDSLWSQLYGAAIVGELDQALLSFFPSTFTEWPTWREEYPDSLVLSKEKTCAQFNCRVYSGHAGSAYAIDAYESYYSTSDAGVINNNIPRTDEPLGTPKERVLGIRVGGATKAYPYAELGRQGVVNDVINGLPVLVWFDPQTQTGTAYIREVDGRTLTFKIDPESPKIVIDAETGSRWQVSSGSALSGRLRDSQLPALIVTSAFAFGWYDYFPLSETYAP